jgi:hypothetical protein
MGTICIRSKDGKARFLLNDEVLESEEGRKLVRAIAAAESDRNTSHDEPISTSSAEE